MAGKEDYSETKTIIAQRMKQYENEMLETTSHMDNKKKFVDAYRK